MENIPAEHIFTQALVSDVEWQAQDCIHPMIIITDDDNNLEGSWYLPLNAAGQIQFQYASSSHSLPTPASPSRTRLDPTTLAGTKKWNNERLSIDSTRSVITTVGELRGRDSRELGRMLVDYTDETPLMIEFLSAEERSVVAMKGRRKVVLWAPVGSVSL
jgi:hypothetical protein